MANSVTMPSGYGASGATYTDDTNPTTGLDNYGYTSRLIPLFSDGISVATYVVGRANAAAASATAADASAQSALNAPGTNATSTTSVAIATGSKSFTIQTGKAYVIGQTLNIASAANPANFMAGQVTAYNSGTGALTVNVTQTGGAGTLTDWIVSMGAIVSSTLPSMTSNSGKFLTNNGTVASWAAAVIPANNGSDFASATAVRTNLGLAVGADVQAYNAKLAALSGLTGAADTLFYFTGTSTAATTGLTTFGRSLIDDPDAATARTTLGAQASNANLTALSGLGFTADKMIYSTGTSALALQTLTGFARTVLDDPDATTARGTLGAAASGANGDITSLTALTSPAMQSIVSGGASALGFLALGGIAWATANGRATAGACTVGDSRNASSISRSATAGVYNLAFTTAPSNASYGVIILCSDSGSPNIVSTYYSKSTSGFTFRFQNGNASQGTGANDPAEFTILVFGTP